MEKSSISYSKMLNYNLKLIPNVGNVMPYQDMMEILFGNIVSDIPRLELINKKFVIDSDDGQYYFVLSKFEEYLLFAKKRIKWDKENLCPINYFDCLDKLGIELPSSHVEDFKLMKLLAEFKQFLVDKNNFYSNMILNLYWNEIFKGVISSYNKMPYMVVLKFKKEKGFPLILNVVDSESSIENSISINSINKEQDFEKLFESWKNILQMDNSDDFVINCLSQVTGSLDLAEFIFKSHEDKDKFIIGLSDLNQIINFKNTKKKSEYIEVFKSMYKHFNLFEEKDDNIYLNFEGFNKYLLNLELSYLNNFEDKERINTLYYNVMDELVNSYKKLYIFAKLV